MNHLIFSASLVAILTFLVGLVAFLKDPQSRSSRLFALYSWSIALWSFCFTRMHVVPVSLALWHGRLLHLGCTFIPVLFFHFAITFSGVYKREKARLLAAYAVTVIYNLLNLFPGFFTGEIVYRAGYAYPRPIGFLYLSYFLLFVTLVIYGLAVLWGTLPRLKQDQAKWLCLFTVVTALAYLGGMNNFLIMIDVQLFPLFPYGLYAVIVYGLVASYLVMRYPFLSLPEVNPP